MTLLSHSNGSFAASLFFFLRKKLPELEIIGPYSCMRVGGRESELLALITRIIYFCHPSLAALNFQSWKVLPERRARLKGAGASEMTSGPPEEEGLSLTLPGDGCAAFQSGMEPQPGGDRRARALAPHPQRRPHCHL